MKLSDYVAEFFAKRNVQHAFGVTGGCIVHILDSVNRRNDMKLIPVQHEQAGAIAADAYARITENIGLVLTTSGPGATNLVTGTCCSYYDSIPVFAITGQVPTGQLKKDSLSRQIGFQETDVISIFKTITKYAALVDDPTRIRFELEKAFYIACSGRPGPVLLDICDDIQRANIDPEKLPSFTPPANEIENLNHDLESKVEQLVRLIQSSERPVIIPGNGIRLSKTVNQFFSVADALNLPVAPTWGAADFCPLADDRIVGTFGVSSSRAGNFVVQNCDLMIALGTRLDTHECGSRFSTFARGAKKVMVDIDFSEIEKFKRFGMNIDLPIHADLQSFFEYFLPKIKNIKKPNLSKWWSYIQNVKNKYPACLPRHENQAEQVNPYYFMKVLSEELAENDILLSDCGGNLIWTMQGICMKKGQRLVTAFNHSPMGYSVPASVGAALAAGKPIACITGDGGAQMNIQELATIVYYKLPVKIFLFNNHGHGIIRQTLDTWLQSRYVAINESCGLALPSIRKVAEAYGMPTVLVKNHSELREQIKMVLNHKGPILCDLDMKADQTMEPKLVFGRPIEDSAPLLDREEFNANMIVPPLNT